MNVCPAEKAHITPNKVVRLQTLEDKNRRLKILHFDQHGKVLFALCEPIDEKYVQEAAGACATTSGSCQRRQLELVWVPTSGAQRFGARTCRRLVVGAAGFGRRLRDVACCASQAGTAQFGLVYVVEPAVGAGALWDEASCRKSSRLCNQKRYLVMLDVERECKAIVSELLWPADKYPNPALRKSELKLFHLTKNVGWVVVEIRFDTENGCEFLTFYTLDFAAHKDKAVLRELMSYSAEDYYVTLTAESCLFYIFQMGSTRVTIYDASVDAFLHTVNIPVLSYHIFKIEEHLYLFPHFWHDANFSKTSPKCLFVYDGCKWTETNMLLDEDQQCKSGKCKGHVSGFSKDVWVAGSSSGLVAVASTSRNKFMQRSCTNHYHIYEITEHARKIKSLKDLAFASASKSMTFSNLIDFGLPDTIFREFVGPLWLRNYRTKVDEIIILP